MLSPSSRRSSEGASTTRPGGELAARLTDPGLYSDDPHPLYERLRSEAPVSWNDERGFWAVATHPELIAVATDPETYCSSKGVLVDEIGVTYPSPPTIMHTDPPDHTRYRKLVQPAFKPSAMRALTDHVRVLAISLIESIEPGVPVDVAQVLSIPFPLQVICELLGVDSASWPLFYEWSEAIVPGAVQMSEDRRSALQAEMYTYLVGVALERRRSPRDDVVSALATAELDGDQLGDDELTMFLVQLLVAGNETSRNLISGGLVALSERPDQWELLHRDPAVAASAVEELVRWTSPVISFMRTATRPTSLRGLQIEAEEPVLLLFASANRDKDVFGPTAGVVDVLRDPNPHVAFGFGAHFCLGATLARMEARIVLEELASRFSSVELAGRVERSPSPVVAGIRTAPLCFS